MCVWKIPFIGFINFPHLLHGQTEIMCFKTFLFGLKGYFVDYLETIYDIDMKSKVIAFNSLKFSHWQMISLLKVNCFVFLF